MIPMTALTIGECFQITRIGGRGMIATIVISAILVVIVGMIVRSMVLKARAGQSMACDCGCSACPMSSCSHRNEPGQPQLIRIQVPKQGL